MTSETAAVPTASAGARRRRDSVAAIRRASFAMCVLLVAQYAVGMAVNLFVTLPRRDHRTGVASAIGRALSNGPGAVALHAGLGLALMVAALSVAVLGTATRRWGLTALAFAGLLSMASAAYNGARFVSTGQNNASFSMAMAWAAGMLAYMSILFLAGRPRC